jgi:hypothetical protein
VQLSGEGEQAAISFDTSVDLSLAPLLQRIFPLARAFLAVAQYMDDCARLDRGLVAHALGVGLRNLVKVRRGHASSQEPG